jgi:UDP-2,4-diacetamido-2,4,6-trideoxy-beta-L-altropyranose hydrolase
MKKVVFRVDSGSHIGIGHVMRCLTLGRELKNTFEVLFICKSHLGSNYEIVEAEFSVHKIPDTVDKNLSDSEKSDYSNWLGGTQEKDATETNKILNSLNDLALVIVDHYSLDKVYESNLNTPYVMVIDDLMNRSHNCDILLDQNISADLFQYKKLTNERCKTFYMGSSFCLLRPEFREEKLRINSRIFNKEIKNIVVFFGAADVNNDTLKFMNAVMPDFGTKFKFTLILSEKHQDFQKCSDMVSIYSNVTLMGFSKNFMELMKSADLFIGAGGTTTWERACLGIASALISVADNQKLVCEKLQSESVCYYLGESNSMSKEKWNWFFTEIVPQKAMWYDFRNKSFSLVDGEGAVKIANDLKKLIYVEN